jgi:hypothetical protein
LNTITVRCLPGDLPSELTIDVGKLEEIGEGVTIEDLDLGDKIEIAGDYDQEFMLAFITPPQKQESLLTEVEEEDEGEAEEGEEGEEGEGVEGEEGEAAEGEGEGEEGAKAEGEEGGAEEPKNQ